jgi:hypothetical protein
MPYVNPSNAVAYLKVPKSGRGEVFSDLVPRGAPTLLQALFSPLEKRFPVMTSENSTECASLAYHS